MTTPVPPAVPIAWGILSAPMVADHDSPPFGPEAMMDVAEINLGLAAAQAGYAMAKVFTYFGNLHGYHSAVGRLLFAIVEFPPAAIYTTDAHPDSLPLLEAMARNAACRLVVLSSGVYPPAPSAEPKPPRTLL